MNLKMKKSIFIYAIRAHLIFSVIFLSESFIRDGLRPGTFWLLTAPVMFIFYPIPNTLLLLIMYYLNISKRSLLNVKFVCIECVIYQILFDTFKFYLHLSTEKSQFLPYLVITCSFLIKKLIEKLVSHKISTTKSSSHSQNSNKK
jgi:hypothetical protein